MKEYRCVFRYAHGNTTINIVAEDAGAALLKARQLLGPEPIRNVEVWDEKGLVTVAVGRYAAAPRPQSSP